MRFYAHRLVVGAASKYLAKLVGSTTGSGRCPVIRVPGVSARVLRYVLLFLYTAQCEVEETELPLLIRAAAHLRLEALLCASTALATQRLAAARSPIASPASPRPSAGAPIATPSSNAVALLEASKIPSAGGIYVVGGPHDARSAEAYDPATERWKPAESLPATVHHGSALVATAGGTLLSCGGHAGGVIVVSDVYQRISSGSDHTWECAPPLSFKRAYAGAACIGEHVYVIGGHDGANRLAEGEMLIVGPGRPQVAGSWAPIARMQSPRAYFGLAALGGQLFAVGGHDGTKFLCSAEAYNPATDRWSPIASMATARGYHGVAVLDGKLYAIGGFDGDSRLRSVEVYDAAEDKWHAVAPLTTPRAFLATAANTTTLFALGGSSAPGLVLATGEAFDPREGVWRALPQPMRGARCFPAAAALV